MWFSPGYEGGGGEEGRDPSGMFHVKHANPDPGYRHSRMDHESCMRKVMRKEAPASSPAATNPPAFHSILHPQSGFLFATECAGGS